MEPGERVAMAGQHQQIVGQGAQLCDRGEPVAERVALRLAERGGWKNTNVVLPEGRYVEVLTGREISGGPVSVAALLEQYPVAVLTIADGDEHTEPTTTTSGDEESPR